MSTDAVRGAVDARRYLGGARKRFVEEVMRLAGEVRQGRSPSQCWREVDGAIDAMRRRMPAAQMGGK